MALTSPSSKEFKPTDDELIQLFLYNKVHDLPLPSNATILEYDLYGDKNPWEIWEEFEGSNSYDGKDLYFFTKRKKKFANGSRLLRTIGLGSWEGEDVGKEVVARETNQRIGIKKRFRFEKSRTQHDGAWIMHEYSLDSSLLSNASANNYVLCRFRKNMRHNVNEETGKQGIRQELTRVTKRRRRTIVLGLSATAESENKTVSGEDIHQEPINQRHNGGDHEPEKLEITTQTMSEHKEEEEDDNDDDDLNMSWPELFSLQLRDFKDFKDCMIEEEDIFMPPNPLYKDLLSERIDKKYIDMHK